MIGVIADDLAGAAEIAGIGWRHGLAAEVILDGRPSHKVELICIDTDSRSCSPREAARRVASAAASLRKAGAKWIYKKVDSVLRGNVVAEIEAVMRQLGFESALLVPANPSLDRTIRRGRYYIRGRPIHRTDFARDPQHPRTSSSVLELLGPARTMPAFHREIGETILESAINVGDVSTARDLRKWAAENHPKLLLAGGAEFFGAILKRNFGLRVARRNKPASLNRETGPELFVCGSMSDSTRAFVNVARRSGVPIFSIGRYLASGMKFRANDCARMGQRVASALKVHPRVVLQIGLPIIHERAAVERLIELLARVASSAIRAAPVRTIYAEGGATAAELARRMGWKRLRIVRELSPGVAMFEIDSAPGVTLTIKPGSYLWPDDVFSSGTASR